MAGISQGYSISMIAKKHDVKLLYLLHELIKGIKVELEHTQDEFVAYGIAKDHLFEKPNYYTLLSKIEKECNLKLSSMVENMINKKK